MPYHRHIDKWKERASIDFFTEFVKAWIPFNAWMNKSYSLTTDREIISELKRASSVKTKLKRLLENTDEESTDFKNYLAKFHYILEELELKNNGNSVNFTSIAVERNRKEKEEFISRGIEYKALYDRTQKKFVTVVTTSYGVKAFELIQNEYNYTDFESNLTSSDISETQKGFIKSAYKEINPYIPLNLITTDESNCIKVGNYNFCGDLDSICMAIIENIYSLRCMLFHGDIEPKEDTEKLFETAYFILKHMLKAIS